MAAWIKQLAKQVEKFGDKAPWYAVWDEPDGTRRMKSCGAGSKGKKKAQDKVDHVGAQLLLGTYTRDERAGRTWEEFAKRYADNVLSGISPASKVESVRSLGHFARILKLDKRPVSAVTAERIDQFRATRRKEDGQKPGSKVSPATVNKDLRHVKAALRVAVEWGYLASAPRIKFEREPEKLPTYINPEHFAKLYQTGCPAARFPEECPAGAAAWWRGLLVFAQMTGWRISEILALEWRDVDLDKGQALTRARDNKGKRDVLTPLHPVVVEHLRPLRAFHPKVFAWELHRRSLDTEFASMQKAAGVSIPCKLDRSHQCTDACTRYSFHDERRAFATLNAPNMTRETLQALMRHASPLTTAKYINIASQLNPAVATLHVPTMKADASAG